MSSARIAVSSRDPTKWPVDCSELPTDKLAVDHPNDNDARIVFDEAPHTYTVDGKLMPISVTSFVHAVFPPVDMLATANNMKEATRREKYGNAAPVEIAAIWKREGEAAANKGTRMHAAIEVFFNTGYLTRDPSLAVETRMFYNWLHNEFLARKLEAFRTEMLVFGNNIAGSIDMVARSTVTGEFFIFDWKCTKDIFKGKGFADKPSWIAKHRLRDCKLVHYSLQLHVYRHLLMTSFGFPFIPPENLSLVVLHPENAGYKFVQCLDLAHIVPEMFAHMPDLIEIYHARKQAHG